MPLSWELSTETSSEELIGVTPSETQFCNNNKNKETIVTDSKTQTKPTNQPTNQPTNKQTNKKTNRQTMERDPIVR